MIIPAKEQTSAAVAQHYDDLDPFYREHFHMATYTSEKVDIRSLAVAPTGTDPDTLSGIEERAVNDAKESAHCQQETSDGRRFNRIMLEGKDVISQVIRSIASCYVSQSMSGHA